MNYKELDTHNYEELQQQYNLGVIASKVLASKQLSEAQIQDLIFSSATSKTFDLQFLDPIVKRLQQAKINNEKVMICGDYDCDGICATTILYDALTRYGITCGYYIPDRFKEGYGLHLPTVKSAIEKGYSILITVDNGVKATKELQYAKDCGMCVILSDHHAYDDQDLVYDYFLHPNVLDPFYGQLCGAGLAYLLSKRFVGNDAYHSVLACIATIGDMVGVLNANRVIIKEGLQYLNQMQFFSISLLADNQSVWDTTKIAFQIVPKINSLGRLADQANVNTFVRYLLIRDIESLTKVASQINQLNDIRKKISAENERLALKLVNQEQKFIVVHSEVFHEGLNGVVAAKISNKYNRPVMVLSQQGEILKGSIRSVGIDLRVFFNDIKDELLSYGGHKQAAGISLSASVLDALIDYCQINYDQYKQEEEQTILLLQPEEVTIKELESLSKLEPFGTDFKKPKFKITEDELEVLTLSNGLHLKFKSPKIEYLYFQHGHLLNELANQPLSFIGDLSINEFRNKKSINMIVDDVLK